MLQVVPRCVKKHGMHAHTGICEVWRFLLIHLGGYYFLSLVPVDAECTEFPRRQAPCMQLRDLATRWGLSLCV